MIAGSIERSIKPDVAEVRRFIETIAAQASRALNGSAQGFLQLSRLHPVDEKLVPTKYKPTDIDRMVAQAVTDSEAGHNVYLEGRTVRGDVKGRGTVEDTVAVFALVIDSDADKNMGWHPTVQPSMVIETSPGNFQFWFFLKEAVAADVGKELGERIRAAAKSDHDTGTITQPYRVAGTVNYPNKKKQERGRVTVPTRIINITDVVQSSSDLERDFPQVEHRTNGATEPVHQFTHDEADLPEALRALIFDGPAAGSDRSDEFFDVIRDLKISGWKIDDIVALFERHPDGVATKYKTRIRAETERCYNKIRLNNNQAQTQQIAQAGNLEALKIMTFAPIKYVVPGIIVEGLTLFAGKPKIGKSWLLLHAGIAVARDGFTLGETHCIEGDVLYCALEDNERRLQSRVTKLLGITPDWPARFCYVCEMPRLANGGLDYIKNWIASKPNPRLIIIDTLAMVRAPKKRDESNYDADYAAVLELRKLANETGVAIVLVHHLRKADADDAFDTVSGTLGLTGAPDSVLVLKRDTTGTIVLHGRGRDLVEIEMAMAFDRETCLWRIAGDADQVRRSTERAAVLQAIEEAGEPVGPNDIASATGMKAANVRRLLGKLVKEGAITKATYGKYRAKAA
jgi:RecA-family ATPase